MTTIDELIERCRKAEGPDRELDARIFVAVAQNREWRDDGHVIYAQKSPSDVWRIGYSGEEVFRFSDLSIATMVPTFTASIDAITALIERELPGWWWRVSQSGAAELHHPDLHGKDEEALAATPVLALCLAFLLALQSKETSDAK